MSISPMSTYYLSYFSREIIVNDLRVLPDNYTFAYCIGPELEIYFRRNGPHWVALLLYDNALYTINECGCDVHDVYNAVQNLMVHLDIASCYC